MGDLITFAAAVAAVFPCALATPTSTCPDKLLPGVSIYQGGIVAASKMVANLSDCCELCHGDFKDECAGWEWIDLTKVRRPFTLRLLVLRRPIASSCAK